MTISKIETSESDRDRGYGLGMGVWGIGYLEEVVGKGDGVEGGHIAELIRKRRQLIVVQRQQLQGRERPLMTKREREFFVDNLLVESTTSTRCLG